MFPAASVEVRSGPRQAQTLIFGGHFSGGFFFFFFIDFSSNFAPGKPSKSSSRLHAVHIFVKSPLQKNHRKKSIFDTIFDTKNRPKPCTRDFKIELSCRRRADFRKIKKSTCGSILLVFLHRFCTKKRQFLASAVSFPSIFHQILHLQNLQNRALACMPCTFS